MDKPRAKQILEDSLPDLELIQSADSPLADTTRLTDQKKPSLAELRKKFLGDEEDDDQQADAIADDDNEVIVGQVRSKTAGTNPADAPEGGKRTIIVSKNGIVGSQG